jgi:hypothetical protein
MMMMRAMLKLPLVLKPCDLRKKKMLVEVLGH